MIFTLLNSLYHTLSMSQTYYKGYDKSVEKEAWCEKALNQDEIKINCTNNEQKQLSEYEFPYSIEIIIKILSELNTCKTTKEALMSEDYFNVNDNKEYMKICYKKLIDITAFRGSLAKQVAEKYSLISSTMTREEYNKLIDSL